MLAYHLYDTWNPRIRELLPYKRVTRVRNVTWMLVGLHMSQSVHLSNIARKLPFYTELNLTTGRFRRFMNNKSFHVRRWYRPTLGSETSLCYPSYALFQVYSS